MIKKRGNRWWVVVYAGRDPLTGRKRHVSQQVHRQRAGSERPGAGQRQHRRQDQRCQQRRPPPGSANGHRPGASRNNPYHQPACPARPGTGQSVLVESSREANPAGVPAS